MKKGNKKRRKLCPHGRKIRSVRQLLFAGAIDRCVCCKNFFGHFGGQGEKPLCLACAEVIAT
jgi:hypothetical protein